MSKADKTVNTARAQIDLTNGIMQTPRLRVEFRDRFDPAGNQSHSLRTETLGAKRFAIRILTQRWVRQATFRESDEWQSPVKAGESQVSVVLFRSSASSCSGGPAWAGQLRRKCAGRTGPAAEQLVLFL